MATPTSSGRPRREEGRHGAIAAKSLADQQRYRYGGTITWQRPWDRLRGRSTGGDSRRYRPLAAQAARFSVPQMATAAPASALANSIYRWSDDLIFDYPGDTSLRPRGYVRDANNVVAPYPQLPGEASLTSPLTPITQSTGNFSWFLTVAPTMQPGTFAVAAAVCYKRVLSATGGKRRIQQRGATVPRATAASASALPATIL